MRRIGLVLAVACGGSAGKADPPAGGGGAVLILRAPRAFDATVPCSDTGDVILENIGSAEAEVTAITVDGEAFTVDDFAVPLSLAPGDAVTFTARFWPQNASPSEAILTVEALDHAPVHLTLEGQGALDHVTDSLTAGSAPLDVLLLVDQSCSMYSGHQGEIRKGVERYLTAAQDHDWHLAVVNDDSACRVGGFVDASTPDYAQLIVDHTFPSSIWEPLLTEQLLELATLAVAQTGPGQCNDGLLRGGPLHVLVISDEPEQSDVLWEDWVDDLETFTPVVVSGAADLSGTCGQGGGGYIEASQETGGTLLDICDETWHRNTPSWVPPLTDASQVVHLSTTPLDATLVVTVDGEVTTAFTYDEEANEVHLDAVHGALIEVTYAGAATCD